MNIDYPLLARRILCPDRFALRDTRAAVSAATNAADAWAALATRGLIPMDWVEDATRSFTDPSSLTVAQCALLAADVAGVLEAEALAHAVSAALVPWGGAAPKTVTWRFESQRRAFGDRISDALEAAEQTVLGGVDPPDLAEAFSEQASEVLTASGFPYAPDELEGQDALVEATSWFAYPAFSHAYGSLCWNEVARSGKRVTGEWMLAGHHGLIGRPFAELPAPHEALLSLWMTGYALDEIRSDALVLIAPEFAAPSGSAP